MYLYIFKRVLLMIPTLFGAAVLVFLLMRLIPGDICVLRLASGGSIDPQVLKNCRAEIGTDQPMLVQFFVFIKGLVTFDFGKSMWTGRPIIEEVGLRFQLSLQVAIMATITAVLLAIPLGIISAVKQNTWIDYVLRTDHGVDVIVIPDVRFPNEVSAIRDAGGWLGKIVRPGYGPRDTVADRALVGWDGWDAVIGRSGEMGELNIWAMSISEAIYQNRLHDLYQSPADKAAALLVEKLSGQPA
jgi:hypothetical protein